MLCAAVQLTMNGIIFRLTGAGLALGLFATTVQAQSIFNTALSPTEANDVLYNKCSGERGRAQDAAATLGWDWADVLAKANQVLLANIDDAQLRRMLDQADRTSGGRAAQDIAQFQSCLLLNKIAYAEAHERRAKR